MRDVWKSHKYFIFEKYYSITAELNNLHEIILIYEKKNILDDNLSELVILLATTIEKEFTRIQALDYNIFYDILIELDYIRVKMQKIINNTHALHTKTVQAIMEATPNIYPIPHIQKRYSSKILSIILDSHHKNLYKSLSGRDADIYSIWTHNDGYKINDFLERKYISNHSFYYHDIAWNIPTIIDHEIILEAIQNNDDFKTLLEKIAKRVENNCISFFNNNEHFIMLQEEFIFKTYFQEVNDFLKNNLENTLWELSADLIGAKLHGEESIISLLHETLGEYVGRGFYVGDDKKNHISFGISIQRESLLLRQSILTTVMAKGLNDQTYIGLICNAFYKLFIAHSDNTNISFDQIMKKNSEDQLIGNDFEVQEKIKGQIQEANIYRRVFARIYNEIIVTFIKDREIEKSINELVKNITWKSESAFFNESGNSISKVLWKKRSDLLKDNNLPHRSILRQNLLENLGVDDCGTPYMMSCQYNIANSLIQNNHVVFGAYSDIIIKPILDPKINIEEKILTCLDSIIDRPQDAHFETKHTLLKIYDNTFQQKVEKNETKFYIFIYLKKTSNPKDILDLMKRMYEGLIKNKDNFSLNSMTLFKSFGPEEIVLEGKVLNHSDAWKVIEYIRNKHAKEIRETFSNITINLNNYTEHLGDNICIKGYYRVAPHISYESFLEKLNQLPTIKKLIDSKKMRIYEITDKFFDFEIWWNEVLPTTIDSFYRSPLIEGIILDMEHFIVQER